MKDRYLIASAWPPARSEIANNVADTQLPALVKRADIVLVGDQIETPDPARLRGMPVLGVADALQQYPATPLIAHIGNQPVHAAAANRALARRPGFVVLHDLVLHHAIYDQCHKEHRQSDYVSALYRYYGRRGEEVGKAACNESDVVHREAGQYPLFEPFLENALGVITHSGMAYETVAERDRWPVCRIGLPYPAPDAATRQRILDHRTAQAEAIAAGGTLKLMVFGHLGPNRGLPLILEALAQINQPRLRLDIYGVVADREAIETIIASHGLQSSVTIHGYVADTTLDAALAASHLAINLRSPTLGEASASQLRLYAAGLPAIVVRHGWYAEQPEAAVRFVRVNHEVAGLVDILAEVLRVPRQLAALAAAGFDHLLDEHHPDAYADSLLNFVRQARLPGWRLLLARHYSARAARAAVALGIPCSGGLPAAINHLLPAVS
jgi:glycosyltransferase involved in cell wall biosynthesis